MLNHCQDHLTFYHDAEDITPICCKKCGRLINYIITLNDSAWSTPDKEEKTDDRKD